MYALIVGCGRLGSRLANQLSRAGHNVVVVDRVKEAFNLLSAEFSGFQVTGDASDQEVLKEAKIQEADLLAAVTDDDNVNLLIAQCARELYHVPKVLARVGDPLKGAIFQEMGLHILCPTTISADAFGAEILKQGE
ncbi:MAG: TrkA family potassium uptake protein [Candidatus Abyssobacteria bacterium SURF_5]|uniref:TrkA family potassium uptake protein n=1 Tax=Abyssobacteria bacterium (strain SURF_5) TaxID=2093360 RepID=A0A3A4P9T8_ABYX5|nr:MAG: TrkA family potassium uptake protein [Candidatus Abyssubacteria bacterium SURF_5]